MNKKQIKYRHLIFDIRDELLSVSKTIAQNLVVNDDIDDFDIKKAELIKRRIMALEWYIERACGECLL